MYFSAERLAPVALAELDALDALVRHPVTLTVGLSSEDGWAAADEGVGVVGWACGACALAVSPAIASTPHAAKICVLMSRASIVRRRV
jgi:hypothetical protein